jgi:hypothetical protein
MRRQATTNGMRDGGRLDRLVKGLGWFSLGLAAVEIAAPGRLAKALGMRGFEPLIRAYGVREGIAGLGALSPMPTPAIWSRVAGDALDIGTLALAMNRDNPKRKNAAIALAAVIGVTLVDLFVAPALSARNRKLRQPRQDFSDRSGWRGSPPWPVWQRSEDARLAPG